MDQCGKCHEALAESYFETYHGKVSKLGYTKTAKCYDCHGAHEMAPASDSRSPVSAERRVATCRKCHEGANANFAAYEPHADPHDRTRNAPLYYTARFMEILFVGVFSFFGIHTLFWFYRELRVKFGGARAGGDGGEKH